MITGEQFKELAVGTEIWSVYPGRVVRCMLLGIESYPSIWGNFPEGLGVNLSIGLMWGEECQHLYLDMWSAKEAALQWELESRERILEKAKADLVYAQKMFDLPIMVEVEDGL